MTARFDKVQSGWSRRFKLIMGVALVWTAFAVLVALVLALRYQGFFRKWAEWQFEAWDRYFPIATAILIVFALLLPFGIMGALIRYRRRRNADDARLEALIRQSGWLLELFCFTMAALSACVLLFQLIEWASLPSDSSPVREIAAQDLDATFDYEGPAAVSGGTVRTDIVAQLDDGIAVLQLRRRYAPVTVDGGARLFLQVVPATENAPETAIRRGILVKRAMPNEIVELYRSIGVPVSGEGFVLYSNAGSMQARLLLVGLASVLFGLFFGLLGHRTRRRRRQPVQKVGDLGADS